MTRDISKLSRKNLFLQGVLSFFVIAILTSIGLDDYVLSYFLTLKTILRILLMAIGGGFFYVILVSAVRRISDGSKNKS